MLGAHLYLEPEVLETLLIKISLVRFWWSGVLEGNFSIISMDHVVVVIVVGGGGIAVVTILALVLLLFSLMTNTYTHLFPT